MNNLLSYCELVDARIRAFYKDLLVIIRKEISMIWNSSRLNTWADNCHKYTNSERILPQCQGSSFEGAEKNLPLRPPWKNFFRSKLKDPPPSL